MALVSIVSRERRAAKSLSRIDATRSLTTIQRGGMVLLYHSNVNLTGDFDISKADLHALGDDITRKKYGMINVGVGLLVADSSGIVLGSKAIGTTPAVPAYMDSIKQVRSLYLEEGRSPYDQLGADHDANWEVVGIQGDTPAEAKLYRITSGGPQLLNSAQENVIVFNDKSKMYVRYGNYELPKYGQLLLPHECRELCPE